jgi:hypothetical protein
MGVIMNNEDYLMTKVIAICMVPYIVPTMIALATFNGIWDLYDNMCRKL